MNSLYYSVNIVKIVPISLAYDNQDNKFNLNFYASLIIY